jgi:protein TonB
VVVNVYVLADGRVGEVQVLTSSGYERLDAAALEHVRRNWRFDPATRDGAAVATWGAFGVTFAITR